MSVPLVDPHRIGTVSAAELIRLAQEHPPEPLIDGLLNVGDIALLHGTEESFKSVFILQVAESLAMGTPLLRFWPVSRRRIVGVIETELHEAMLGVRLANMFQGTSPPEGIRFFGSGAMHSWRRARNLDSKFRMIGTWLAQENIQVLLIDTANDFFRGNVNPNDETAVGEFFDEIRNLHASGCMMIRHDRKQKGDDIMLANPNERIRGSAEWKEDPEAILNIECLDRRTHEVRVEIGKLRYGRKPEPLPLWFDAASFRLVPLPPIIAVLETVPKSRQELLAECRVRFGLGERKTDEMLAEQRRFLRERQAGHEKIFELEPELAKEAPWARFLLGQQR